MKTLTYLSITLLLLLGNTYCSRAQQGDLFPGHMIAPAELAKNIGDSTVKHPMILNIGPRYNIPGAIKIGAISEDEGKAKFEQTLASLPRDQDLVVYCGCCPYEHCPNVRPAVAQLEQMKFTNYKVLDLPHNIQTDWTEKGYPRE